jgi:uncharacterized protein (DUF2235 family)
MGRNIVICSDGTGNAFTNRPSNAARIVELLAMDDPERQVVAYDQGIGTDAKSWRNLKERSKTDPKIKALEVMAGPHESWFPPARWWHLARGLVNGAGLRENVKQMYCWLADSHRGEDDRVFLFGFSRGAFTVRALAGLIYRCGLPAVGRPDNHAAFDAAWGLYLPMHDDKKRSDAFWRDTQARRCVIHFLGLWDTVKSYGDLRPVLLPHLRHNPIVGTVCHAMHSTSIAAGSMPRVGVGSIMTGESMPLVIRMTTPLLDSTRTRFESCRSNP